MALLIQPPVTVALKFGSFFRGDCWLPSIFIYIINQLPAVITSVGKYIASFYINMLQYRDSKIDVVTLPLAEHQIYGIAIGVYCRVDFAAGSAPAVSNFVWEPPFLAPALC